MLKVLEGHTDSISCLSFSANGIFLASKSHDVTIRIWRSDTWETVAIFNESSSASQVSGIAFHPYLLRLATLGKEDRIIRIWDLDKNILLTEPATIKTVRYTTAKLVLVGDSGVGKTGLGWRLAHGKFVEHSSTHGMQFWVIPQLGETREDGTECEAVLWDLAMQHIYRSIHSIFLDDVDLSIILFDPTNRQDPLKGVEFWLEQLKGKNRLPPSILVGARLDRGAAVLSQQELIQFCQHYGISGGYISTSAVSGEGVDKLLETVKAQIPWEQKTTTVTTKTFKRIKEYVLSLKEKPDRKGVLVSPANLRQQLQATDKDWKFSDAEVMSAVGHLQNHGYVAILKSSAGDEYVLMMPDLLATLASSIVLQADKNPLELGALSEMELLQGKIQFEELNGIVESEQQILIDAAILRFLEHNICFRETTASDTLLIFPGLIKQKRPLKDDIPSIDDISYIVRGRVENIYASLVVLLGYTPSFTRINQWQNQAQYETSDGKICGFRLIEEREGENEFVLYYGIDMLDDGRHSFQELFEQFLYKRDVEVRTFPLVLCPNGHRQERATVVKRLREEKQFLHCDECGAKTDLPSMEKPQAIGTKASPWLQCEEAVARFRSEYETQLSRVKGYRRSWAAPRCYISSIHDQANCRERLIHDLNDAGIYIIENALQVQKEDFVIVLDSPAYQQSWRDRLLEDDAKLIEERFGNRNLISIVIEGKSSQTTSHDMQHCSPGDFCDETHYPVSLFDLVLNLYAIPLNHPGFEPLRWTLHQRWEQTLARISRLEEKHTLNALKIFISYAHEDEAYERELTTMLAGIQRQGLIDIWQYREISEGDEWLKEIENAMNQCDLALLLISKYFIDSRFIQGKEVPHLLERRKMEGLQVVPIILDYCMWDSEPVLSDLQAMPRYAKQIASFPIENGERSRVLREIGKAIEKKAKEKHE